MERGGQQGGGPDRGQNAVNAFNSTQGDPLPPPTDSSSPCTLEWLQPQHADVINNLRLLHQDRAFCDFTLHQKEGPLRFSRLLLASMSPFFEKLVTVDMKESRSSEVNMEHVTQETWNCITSFYFSSSKLVSVDNVLDVLETSHMYELEKLVQYCSDFLQSHCCADNCLDLWKVATHFDLESVVQKARRVLADNFPTLCKDENFLTVEKAILLELLEKEEVVTTEDDLCQALLAWMEKNNADADTCTEVFQQLRLNLISAECFQNLVLSHSVCMRSPCIQSLVTQEKSRRACSGSLPPTQERARKRRPSCAKNSLLVLRCDQNKVSIMYMWSFDARRWTTFPGPSPREGRSMSCTILGDSVVVTGGTSNRSTHLFDLPTQVWLTGPDLLQGRYYRGMTSIRNTAYVVGGQDDNRIILSSIEEYSKGSGRWTPTGCLHEAAVGCGVAALGDTILVVGGNRNNVAQTFNVHTRSAAVLDVRLLYPMSNVRAASCGTSFVFLGSSGELAQFQEVDGQLQITSQVLLENFPRSFELGLLASNSCVRVIGSSCDEFVSCWDFNGKKIENDDMVERLPGKIQNCLAVEVNIPAY